jgi:hypothetical protein
MRIISALLALALATAGLFAATGTASAAEAPATRLALAVPLTVPPEATGLIAPESLQNYTSPTGILTRTLDAVEGQAVAIGIDPMVIASIRILGNTAPQSAIDWLQRLGQVENETFALSYADSDVAALSQAGSATILAPIAFQIDPTRYPVVEADADEPVSTPSPGQSAPPDDTEIPTSETLTTWPYTLDGIVWPRKNTMTAADLAAFNAVAPVTTILSSGNVTATPAASASVGESAVLVSDEILSNLMSDALNAFTPAQWQVAVSALTTELLRVAGGHTVLATVDRVSVDSPRLGETIAAIAPIAGVLPSTIAEAQAEPKSAARVADIPVDADRASRIRLLLAAEARIIPFASILTDPTALTGERRLSLLALSSNSWADSGAVWVSAVDDWLVRSGEILTSVQVAESSELNFFQDRGNLPIAVSNTLPYPVTVYVSVRPSTGILVVTQSRVPVEIPAGSQVRALIPVQSIANGQAALQVSLSSGTDVAIGTPHTVTANVVAGWETTATFVIAGLLIVLFIAGIVRTVLKRRRARREESEPALEQDE